MATKAVVFDLGGVLIDWDPRYLYRKLLADEAAVEEFLATVCTPEWNLEQDRGRPFAEGVAELVERHPVHAAAIAAYHERWPEMLGGGIEAAVELLAELRAAGVPLYALTNWSAETFGVAWERYEFLSWFDEHVGMRPVWLCPLRTTRAWPSYRRAGGISTGTSPCSPWPSRSGSTATSASSRRPGAAAISCSTSTGPPASGAGPPSRMPAAGPMTP